MFSRPLKFAAIAIVIGANALAAEEGHKCTATAQACEQAIRQMLSGRRYLGAEVEETNPGLTVKTLTPQGPAERADLRVGDRLMLVNGHATSDATIRDFKQILNEAKATGRLSMVVQRHGILKRIDVRLEPYSKAQIDKIVAQHLAQAHASPVIAPQPQQ